MRRRRAIITFIVGCITLILLAGAMPRMVQESIPHQSQSDITSDTPVNTNFVQAREDLEKLEVKGRAPKTGYERAQFGDGWEKVNGCSTRDIILFRDLENTTLDDACKVLTGTLNDPYTGKVVVFTKEQSSKVQIDHIVALSDAWQKGAQSLSKEQRRQLANDPQELLAVDGQANQEKSDGDAATWLPQNKGFRCTYVARQIAVKVKYSLWVTQAEKAAMLSLLKTC